jgi:undecaprenyl-diphosphatase
MEYVQSIVLGIVQGVAEFLPISSSGHLVLVEEIIAAFFSDSALQLGDAQENLALNIALHVGTLGSIVVVFWRQLLETLHQPKLMAAIVVATLPVVVVGLLLRDRIETAFGSSLVVGVALCVTAALLWVTPRVDQGSVELPQVSLWQALVIGLFQAIAPVPGVSRSGSTIVGGLVAGLNRDASATFSFLIAIPAIGGAATLEVVKLLKQGPISQSQWGAYAAGMSIAFVVGVLALRWLLKVVSARKLHYFAWYCLGVGLLTISLSWLGV